MQNDTLYKIHSFISLHLALFYFCLSKSKRNLLCNRNKQTTFGCRWCNTR